MAQVSHTIGKLEFRLDLPDLDLGKKLQQDLRSWMDDGGEQTLEDLIKQYYPEGDVILIDRLEINLDELTLNEGYIRLKEKIMNGLEEALRKSIREKNHVRLSHSDESMVIFFHYLEFGVLPWWAKQEGPDILEARALSAASAQPGKFTGNLFRLSGHPVALKRLTMQFSDRFSLEMMKTLFPDLLSELSYIIHIIPEIFTGPGVSAETTEADSLKLKTLEAVWHALLSERDAADASKIVSQVLRRLLAENGLSLEKLEGRIPSKLALLVKDLNSAEETSQVRPGKWKEDIVLGWFYIENAGLVLLWPFLSQLFSGLDLLSDGKFTDERSHARALALTQYLVYGGQSFDEPRLVLNKLLLGWPMEQPTGRMSRLNEKEKQACLTLLEEVIRHWQVLRNTSVAGLRKGFLQRMGKLRHEEGQWVLNFEKSGADVLLNHLPWPYQLIRLPWMEEPLVVI